MAELRAVREEKALVEEVSSQVEDRVFISCVLTFVWVSCLSAQPLFHVSRRN